MSNVFSDFLVNSGLYEKIEITKDNINDLCELADGKVKLNLYCKSCGEMRVHNMEPMIGLIKRDESKKANIGGCIASILRSYQQIQNQNFLNGKNEENSDEQWYWTNWQTEEATRIMTFSFSCAMDDSHRIDYVVRTEGYTMIKIGQYPTIADLEFSQLKEYEKVMSKEDRKEMGTAIGLYAHGVGVGSYVYLRRIFERILYESKENAGESINEELFEKASVGEKIDMLKDYLPDILTANKNLYAILSKGIHELSEDDCRKYFPVVKDSIFMILEQWEKKRKNDKRMKEISEDLSKISSKIN